MLSLIQFLGNDCLHIVIAFEDLSKLDLGIHLILLHFVLELLLALLSLIEGNLLLQCAIFHLLVLKHERLHLAIELLENHLIVLDHELQILVFA